MFIFGSVNEEMFDKSKKISGQKYNKKVVQFAMLHQYNFKEPIHYKVAADKAIQQSIQIIKSQQLQITIKANQQITIKANSPAMQKQQTDLHAKSVIYNLQAITLYIYGQKFLIEPHAKTTHIKTNLIINRNTHQIVQINKSEPIPGNFDKKSTFSAFLGILPILNKSFLVFVETCEKACTIEAQDVFEIRQIGLVPFEPQQAFANNEADQKINKIFNYLLYMKNYLLKEGYYFSYDYDLTLSRQAYSEGYPTKLKYAWNLHMGKALLKLNDRAWFSAVIQGSIKYFKAYIEGKQIEYFLLTRRSFKKGGTRYNARGLDSKGQVANFCQTQQIIIINNYCFSHVQIRGSVPMFWKQTGIYAEVQFYKNHEQTKQAFLRHFQKLQKNFNNIFCINLLSKEKSGQLELTMYYEQLIKEANLPFVRYEFYDFHFACRGQKFERSNYLIEKVRSVNRYFKYYTENIDEKKVISLQNGVMRVNCIDCLDRTNLIQSKIAYDILNTILVKCGFDIFKVFGANTILEATDNAETTNSMIIKLKNAWADNGDTISKHYTGTGSTHTNVTRTGKRDLKGIMDHGLKTLGRFYKQYMQDNFKQQVIDILIGEHTETINLTEFESRLKQYKQTEADNGDFVEI